MTFYMRLYNFFHLIPGLNCIFIPFYFFGCLRFLDLVFYSKKQKMNLKEQYKKESGFDVEIERRLGSDLIGSDYVEWLEEKILITKKTVITTEYNAFKDTYSGLAVIQGRKGTHELYDVVYNGICTNEYFATEEEARAKAELEYNIFKIT